MRLIWIVLCIALATTTAIAQDSSTPRAEITPETQNSAQTLANSFRNWEKITTSGVTTSVKVSRREEANGKLQVAYRFRAEGVPAKEAFSVKQVVIPFQAHDVFDGVTFRKDGVAICSGRSPDVCGDADHPDDPIDFVTQPAKGEPYRWLFVSSDNIYKIAFVMVPDPIKQEQNGWSLEIIRLTPRFEMVLLRMRGFKPGETAKMASESYKEAHNADIAVDAQGGHDLAMLPAVAGKSSGTTHIKVSGASCAPSIEFEWGKL